MTLFLIALATLMLAGAGRLILGSWFNHATHYSLAWGISLLLFELRLIEYYPLRSETWIFISSAWLAFFAGSLIVPLGGYRPAVPARPTGIDLHAVRNAILLLSGMAAVAVVQHWTVLVAKFGSIANVIVLGNIVYGLRLTDQLDVGIPYLDSLALPASLLGGVYLGLRRRFAFVAIIPLLVVIAEAIGMMGRMKILIAVILLLTGYFLVSWRTSLAAARTVRAGWRKWMVVGICAALFAAAGEVVRSKRGIEEAIPAAGQSLRALKTASIITPSIYLYLTVHHGVFDQYLRWDDEQHPIGANTLGPVYRGLSWLGLETWTPHHERFYRTPVSANSGTWLRELHGDFGPVGLFVVPFLLGAACSMLLLRYRAGGGLVALVLFAHLLVVVDLSTMIMGTRLGYWLVSLLSSVGVALYLGRQRERTVEA